MTAPTQLAPHLSAFWNAVGGSSDGGFALHPQAAIEGQGSPFQEHWSITERNRIVTRAEGPPQGFGFYRFGKAIRPEHVPLSGLRLDGHTLQLAPELEARIEIFLGPVATSVNDQLLSPKLVVGAVPDALLGDGGYSMGLLRGGKTLVGILNHPANSIPLLGTNTKVHLLAGATVAVTVMGDGNDRKVVLSGFANPNVPDKASVQIRIGSPQSRHHLAVNALNGIGLASDPNQGHSIMALLAVNQHANGQSRMRLQGGLAPEVFSGSAWLKNQSVAHLTLTDGAFRLVDATTGRISNQRESREYELVALPDGRHYLVIPGTKIQYDDEGRVTGVFVTRNTKDQNFYDHLPNRRAERLDIIYQADGKVILTFTPANLGPLDDDPENPRSGGAATEVIQLTTSA